MKRIIALITAVLLLTAQVMAADVSVVLDGNIIEFASQKPVIQHGRTLIPLRGVFEKLGYSIDWKEDTKTAVLTKDGHTVDVTAGAGEIVIDSSTKKALDVPAQIINGSMMLPLRAVGEAGGLVVSWDDNTKTVSIQSGKDSASLQTASDIPEEDMKIIKSAVNMEYICASLACLEYGYAADAALINYGMGDIFDFPGAGDEIMALADSGIKIDQKYIDCAKELVTNSETKALVDKFIKIYEKDIECINFAKEYMFSGSGNSRNDTEVQKKTAELESQSLECQEDYYEEYDKVASCITQVLEDERYNEADPHNNKLTPEQKEEKEEYIIDIVRTINEELKFITAAQDFPDDYTKYNKAAQAIRDKVNSTKAPLICTYDKEAMLCACDCLDTAAEAVKEGAVKAETNSKAYLKLSISIINVEEFFHGIFLDKYISILDGEDIEMDDELSDYLERIEV